MAELKIEYQLNHRELDELRRCLEVEVASEYTGYKEIKGWPALYEKVQQLINNAFEAGREFERRAKKD